MVKNPADQVAALEKAIKDLLESTFDKPNDAIMPKINHEGNKLLIGF